MKCLVTGGAGFLGSHIVDELVRRKEQVLVLDNLSSGERDNVSGKAVFVEGDVCDALLVDELFSEHEIGVVYHAAAYAAEGLSHHIRNHIYNNNIVGSSNLINASIRGNVQCFCFTSSAAVYGEREGVVAEGDIPSPMDPYGVSKWAIEQDLACANAYHGLNYVIFRPHNIYGERQNTSDKYRNVIGIFMDKVMRNEAMTVFGDGEQSRCFTYVSDIVPVIAESAFRDDCYGKTFNIGTDKAVTINHLVTALSAVFNRKLSANYLPPRLEASHVILNHEKIRQYFEFKEVEFEDGLRRMAGWVKAHWPHRSPAFPQIEVEKSLPQLWQI